jgi:hypothetical protein
MSASWRKADLRDLKEKTRASVLSFPVKRLEGLFGTPKVRRYPLVLWHKMPLRALPLMATADGVRL